MEGRAVPDSYAKHQAQHAELHGAFGADRFGAVSERVARFFGTPKYILGQTMIVIVWIFLNGLGIIRHWDLYPFILLNLAFSTQAAYAAPLILLAQNRQADRDHAEVERDREINARSLADTAYLAREIAAVRIALEHKADREDLVEPLERLTEAVESLQVPERE